MNPQISFVYKTIQPDSFPTKKTRKERNFLCVTPREDSYSLYLRDSHSVKISSLQEKNSQLANHTFIFVFPSFSDPSQTSLLDTQTRLTSLHRKNSVCVSTQNNYLVCTYLYCIVGSEKLAPRFISVDRCLEL